jgi:hypothetical protein
MEMVQQVEQEQLLLQLFALLQPLQAVVLAVELEVGQETVNQQLQKQRQII